MPYLVNGRMQENAPLFDATNRAFRYGDGLFETIKVAQSYPLFFRTHYSRLVRGLDSLGYTIPDTFTMQYFLEILLNLIRSNQVSHGTIRMQAYREGQGTYKAESNEFGYIAEIVQTHEQPFYTFSKHCERLGLCEEHKKDFSTISAFKSGNSLVYVLASLYAQQHHYDNVLLLNSDKKVLEGIAESIFLFSNGTLITPKVSDGCIEGVMRAMIKKIAKWNHIPLEEQSITVEEVLQADEVFLTNVTQGIIPVHEFKGKTYAFSFTDGLKLKLNERVAQIIEKLR